MKKILLLSRVSTQKQDLSQMEHALINSAHSLGYTDEQIIKVSRKESGVKLAVAERESIQEMYSLIESDKDIECVMAYELSRVGRRGDVLYEVRNYLQSHRVQLRIVNPECIVFNSDWSINTNANLIFGLFVSMAENESMLMKERMKRGKQKSAEMNKFVGGKVLYGYDLDENGFFKINPEQSEIIKQCYILRTEQKLSIAKIKDYLESLGHNNITWSTVKTILCNEHYTGKSLKGRGKSSKHLRSYPPIISQSLFEDAQKVGQEMSCSRERKGKHQWLGKGFLRCAECGSLLGLTCVGERRFFGCRTNQRSKHQSHKCSMTANINAEYIEDLLWIIVKYWYKQKMLRNKSKTIKTLKTEKRTMNTQITNTDLKIQTIKKRLSKFTEMYLMDNLSEEELESTRSKIKGVIDEHNKKITEFKERLSQIDTQLSALESSEQSSEDLIKMLDSVDSIENTSKKNEIAHTIISKVTLDRYKNTKHKEIRVHYLDGSVEGFFIRNYTGWIGVTYIKVDGQETVFDEPIEWKGYN